MGTRAAGRHRRLIVLFGCTAAATIPIAWLSYRAIELPFIAAGRWLIVAAGWGAGRPGRRTVGQVSPPLTDTPASDVAFAVRPEVTS